ncbi:unnamed protein product, partial [marine sediment metagenome]
MPPEEFGEEQALLQKIVRAAADAPAEPSPGAAERIRRRLGTRKTGTRWVPVAAGAALAAALVLVLSLVTSSRPRTLLSNVAVVRGQAIIASARLVAGASPCSVAVGQELRSSDNTLIVADLSGAGR